MACPCPYCGIEYEDVNALVAQRNAALRDRHRQAIERLRPPDIEQVIRDNQPWAAGARQHETIELPDSWPDSGRNFVQTFGGGGR
jgi:hypothetical protein